MFPQLQGDEHLLPLGDAAVDLAIEEHVLAHGQERC
jgi:hypothetical protein